MQVVKGITWDHPRGFNALAAAADKARSEGLIDLGWDKQPLEGFESHPIADLCARYDLVVLDHPHVGEAVAQACLRPLEDVFGADVLAGIGADTIGPCLASYDYAGSHWALPLDAATQVMARRPDLVGETPVTWAEVEALSDSTGKVALSLAGPHACLSFLSIAAAIGEPAGREGDHHLVSDATGIAVYSILQRLAARSPQSVRALNPIGILGHMADHDDIVLCPLIYGYVNYSAPKAGHRIAFSNAPRIYAGGAPGSTLGGTGIGISKRCDVTPELKAHLIWLMRAEAQIGFIPAHEGQPSRREAWADAGVNRAWGNFYRDTADTLENAYVRPRFDGYIKFQTAASALLRQAFEDRRDAASAVRDLNALYQTMLP